MKSIWQRCHVWAEMIGQKNNIHLRAWRLCPPSSWPTNTAAEWPAHHAGISELSPFSAPSITSNPPPKTWRIKAESITHSSLHLALLFGEITAEGEKQSQDPILFRREAPASLEDKRRTLLSSLWLRHNNKKISFMTLGHKQKAGINRVWRRINANQLGGIFRNKERVCNGPEVQNTTRLDQKTKQQKMQEGTDLHTGNATEKCWLFFGHEKKT